MNDDVWITRFVEGPVAVLRRVFRPSRVVIFGSQVTGDAREDSDIDVIIVSDAFEGVPFVRRMGQVSRAAPFAKHVDYLCYTGREYEHMRREFAVVMEAETNGVVVGSSPTDG